MKKDQSVRTSRVVLVVRGNKVTRTPGAPDTNANANAGGELRLTYTVAARPSLPPWERIDPERPAPTHGKLGGSAPLSDKRISQRMRLDDADDKIWDWVAPPVNGPLCPNEAVKVAIEALWSFYNRPPAPNICWDLARDVGEFAARLARSPDALIAACQDVLYHPDVQRAEADALRLVVHMGEALNIRPACPSALAADLRCGAVQYRVTVRNLSSRGAMVSDVSRIEVGDRATIRINDGVWTAGTIVWVIDDTAGLAFTSEK
jgi:hypothetical protein